MTTRALVEAEAASYLHRTDMTAVITTFMDRANTRVGQDFRTTSNTQSATLTSGSGYLLPADFKEMISVSTSGSGGLYALQPVSLTQNIDYGTPGGNAWGYAIAGGYLQPTPGITGNINISYYAALVLAAGPTSTNLLLDTYTQAYLWYILMQCYLYIGASEESVNYLNLYLDEKDRANAVNRQKIQPNSSVVGTTGIVVTAT